MAKLLSSELRSMIGLPWSALHFFYCDERLVPFSHPESTHGVYERELFSKVPIPRENIHPVNTKLTLNDAAKDYQEQLLDYFGASNGFPRFDILLLGLGPDGHTCSLFPDHELIRCMDKAVAPIQDSPKPPPERVTLTLPVLNKAKNVFFLVYGSEKAEAIFKIFNSSVPTPSLPPTLIHPPDGEMVWFLDKASASRM